MSVINQVLLDLEKRRASPSERGTVPNHVRALPDSGGSSHWPWIVGSGAAVLATAAAAAWVVLTGSGMVPASPPVQRSGAEAAIEQVVTVSAGVTPSAERAAAPAFQLSFELSNLPAETVPVSEPRAEKSGAPSPLPTARIVGRPGAEPATESATISRTERPAVVAATKPVATGAQPDIKKQVRQPSARELAENEYRKGANLLHQGRFAESQEAFEAALNLYPAYHGARQALVALLVEAKRLGDAERILQEGIAIAPSQIGFSMALARLQVDRDPALATATLRKGVDYAHGSPDYIAFLAALLQRQGRHEEAIEQFQTALRLRPGSGVWWLGLGISLQAVNRTADAQDAYRRARTTNNLTPELAAFAEQRIKQLQ